MMSDSVSVGNGNGNGVVSVVGSSDLVSIKRSIRNLAATAEVANLEDLRAMHKKAYANLLYHMGDGGVLAVDPELSLTAYKTISTILIQLQESDRKKVETLIKARTIMDAPPAPKEPPLTDFEDLPNEVLVSQGEAGIFGNIGEAVLGG